MTEPFTLKDHGITVAEIHRNLPPSALYEHAIRYEKDASIAENSALVRNGGPTRNSKIFRSVARSICGQGNLHHNFRFLS
jgi:hypothetical protein